MLAITCLLRYPRRHNITALFVNTVFSDKGKILIKIYQFEGHNARQLRTEFPDKGWTKSSINTLLNKLRDMGTVDRRQSSDRPRSAHIDENFDQVNDMVLSQEDQPRTHSTDRGISWKTDIPKSSDVRIIRKDLQLKCFKRRRTSVYLFLSSRAD